MKCPRCKSGWFPWRPCCEKNKDDRYDLLLRAGLIGQAEFDELRNGTASLNVTSGDERVKSAEPNEALPWSCPVCSCDPCRCEIIQLQAELKKHEDEGLLIYGRKIEMLTKTNREMRAELEAAKAEIAQLKQGPQWRDDEVQKINAQFRMKQDDWIQACREIDDLKAEVERLKPKDNVREFPMDFPTKHDLCEEIDRLAEQRDALKAKCEELRALVKDANPFMLISSYGGDTFSKVSLAWLDRARKLAEKGEG